jgi:formylmethanofuran dehydrogenase subunit E
MNKKKITPTPVPDRTQVSVGSVGTHREKTPRDKSRGVFTLKQAIDFHGHLGPYLVLGLLMGKYALSELRARQHFGLRVKVWGAKDKPRSCLIDGLQLSTGCTYGKGNIVKYNGAVVKVNFYNRDTKEGIDLLLSDEVIKKLEKAIDRPSSEMLAREIYKTKPERLFIKLQSQTKAR